MFLSEKDVNVNIKDLECGLMFNVKRKNWNIKDGKWCQNKITIENAQHLSFLKNVLLIWGPKFFQYKKSPWIAN